MLLFKLILRLTSRIGPRQGVLPGDGEASPVLER
jgi:hypothetical protein